MLLTKELQIIVFEVTNDVFRQVGTLNQFTSLIWPTVYRGYGEFKITCPVTEETKNLMKEGYWVWCDGYKNACIIQDVKAENDDEGVFTFEVTGFSLEFLLSNRIIWGTYNAVDKDVSTVAMELVDQSCISPTDANRKYNYMVLGEDEHIGGKITKQQTGDAIYNVIEEMTSDADIGFSVDFYPVEQKIEFNVNVGVDRSAGQSENKVVILSTDMEDILSSSYESNIQEEKTIAFVQGEDKGESRKSVTSGDDEKTGYDRKELYVDARDVQSKQVGSSEEMTPEEYNEALKQRGLEKLSEYVRSQSFETSIRVFGETQYTFGEDYFVGDKITVQDLRLGVQVDAVVSEAEETFEETYDLTLTVGFSNLTILQKITRVTG